MRWRCDTSQSYKHNRPFGHLMGPVSEGLTINWTLRTGFPASDTFQFFDHVRLKMGMPYTQLISTNGQQSLEFPIIVRNE